MDVYETITSTITAILLERGDPPPELTPETRVSASGLDSLDIATLVVRLEERLGIDPFRSGNLERYPRTLGEMTELYVSTLG